MIEIMGTKYLSEKEASKRYGYSQKWFQKRRYSNLPPPYMKLQNKGKIFYPLSETDAWFKKNFIMIRDVNDLPIETP